MRPLQDNPIRSHGFSLAELLVAIGITGIVTAAALPVFVNVLQTQQAKGAAQELVNLLNQARQLAIATNGSYRVEIEPDNNRLRFVRTTGNLVWIGPGTDEQGYRRLENQAKLSKPNPNFNPTFNHLGTVNLGTITVQDSRSSSSLNIVISSTTGRIRICDPAGCP